MMRKITKKSVFAIAAALCLLFTAILSMGAIPFAGAATTTNFTVSKTKAETTNAIYIYGKTSGNEFLKFDAEYVNAQDVKANAGLSAFFNNVTIDGVPLSQDAPGITYGINFFKDSDTGEGFIAISSLDTNNAFVPLAFEDGATIVLNAGLALLKKTGADWGLTDYRLSETQTFVYNAEAIAWTEVVEPDPDPVYTDCAVSNVLIGKKNSIAISFKTMDGAEITTETEGVNAQDRRKDAALAPFFDNILIDEISLSGTYPAGVIYSTHLFNPTNGSEDHIAIFSFNETGMTDRDFSTGTKLTLRSGLVLLAYDTAWKLSEYRLTETKVYTYNADTLEWIDESAITGMSLSMSDANLEMGKTLTLTAQVTGGSLADKETIVWSSSAESVATVDENGVVTSVAVGSAVIRATAADGKTSRSCTVKVAAADAINSIMISQSKAEITAGKTLDLNATVTGNSQADTATVVWTTSDPTVATVDANGVVTAVSAGSCIITATSADPSKKAVCSVKVVAAPKQEEEESGCGSAKEAGIALLSLLTLSALALKRR